VRIIPFCHRAMWLPDKDNFLCHKYTLLAHFTKTRASPTCLADLARRNVNVGGNRGGRGFTRLNAPATIRLFPSSRDSVSLRGRRANKSLPESMTCAVPPPSPFIVVNLVLQQYLQNTDNKRRREYPAPFIVKCFDLRIDYMK
jgi:hypothetical protein